MRSLILVLSLMVSSAAFAGMHEQKGPSAEEYFEAAGPEQQKLIREIEAFLETYADLYNKQDYENLLKMWDQNDPNPMYMAEEVTQPMYGWEIVGKYFDPVPGIQILDGIRNEYSEVRAHYLAPDIAFATYKLRYDIKVRRQKAMTGWDRVVAVFRRVDGDWKMTTYAEAPMAPGTMLRMALEDAVPEDFDDYIEEMNKNKQ